MSDVGIRSVDRALTVLRAFGPRDDALSLTELARRSGLNKTTTLRLLGTLERHAFVVRLEKGGYRLGPTLFQLGNVFRRSLKLEDHVMPALGRLMADTGESASFFMRERDMRRCMFRVDSPHAVRDHTQVGDLLPISRGSFGRALTVFDHAPAEPVPPLPIVTSGERDPEMGSIATPVLDGSGRLVGAIGISLPTYRLTPDAARHHVPLVMREALALTCALGGDPARLEAASVDPVHVDTRQPVEA